MERKKIRDSNEGIEYDQKGEAERKAGKGCSAVSRGMKTETQI